MSQSKDLKSAKRQVAMPFCWGYIFDGNVCVCVFIFFYREGFFRLQDVQDILEGTDQRGDCVMPSSIIAVSENAIFHLQRRKLRLLYYWRENDMI